MNRLWWMRWQRAIGSFVVLALLWVLAAQVPAACGQDGSSGQAEKKEDEKNEDDKKKEDEKKPPKEGVTLDPNLQKRIDDMLKQAAKKGPAGAKQPIRKPPTQPAEDPKERLRRMREERLKKRQEAALRSAGATPPASAGGKEGAGDSTHIEIAPNDDGVAPESRTYRFSIKDGTYEQLVKGFARQTGLGVIGEAPRDGRVNFITTEELSFDETLGRIRMLLFNYKAHDPYWLERRDTHLEVIRVADFYRDLPIKRMYPSLESFRAAGVSADELALVIYTPRSGSVADLSVVRDFVPDYMRVTPLQERNAVAIFGLAKDIDKYLSLISIFTGGRSDPRTLERIEVVNLLPSEALEKLRQLTDLDGASTPRARSVPRRRGQQVNPLDAIVEPALVIIPEDIEGFLIVHAMQDKIEEIKTLLAFVDVPMPESDIAPVVIPLEHADAGSLVQTLQQILAVTSAPATAGAAAPKPARRTRRATGRSPAGAVSADSVTLMPHPSKNAIIVLADAEEPVQRIRELIAMFDVEVRLGPLRIELEYIDPTDAANTITSVLGAAAAGAKPAAGSARMQLVPDASGGVMWFTGTQAELDDVRAILAEIDVAAEPVSLHVYRLENRLPSFVANMLREYDGAVLQPQSAPAAGQRGRGRSRAQSRARRGPPVASKFTADDDEMRLLVLCTDADWQEYLPFIQKLEESVDPQKPFERVALTHVDPNTAIERLNAMITMVPGPGGGMRLVASEEAILVIGSTPDQLEQVHAFVKEIDLPWTIEQRVFEIKHKDPAEIRGAIEALIASPVPGRSGRAGGRRRAGGAKGAPTPAAPPTVTQDLTVVEMGNKLIVRAAPETLDEIAALIEEFDVEDSPTEMRVYGDFPPGTDVLSLSETVKSVVSGTKGPRGPGRAPTTLDAGTRFIPYPPSNKLIVIAEASMFPDIERVLELFRSSPDAPPIEVAFVAVEYADPAEVIDLISPLLDMKIRRMVQSGEVAMPSGAAGTPQAAAAKRRAARASGAAAGDRYHLAADAMNKRIVIAAQRAVIDVATELIEQFDIQSEEDEIVFTTVTLTNSDSMSMVKAVKEIIGAGVRTSRRRAAAGAKTPQEPAGSSLTIAAAPTGTAIILRGTKTDVEQATTWIEELDGMATSGQLIRVFQIQTADIKKLVELILHMVDSGPRPKQMRVPVPRRSRGAGGLGGLDEEEEDPWETSKTWTAPELFIQADLIGNTMLVATTETKMARIESIIKQVDEDETMTDIFDEPDIPSFAYELKYADPLDASWDADAVFGELFHSSQDPKVRTAFFGDNLLIVEHPDESRFGELRELIRTYVDKLPDEELEVKTFTGNPPEGLNAEEVALWIKMNHPEVQIELIDISETPVDYLIEEIRPYRPERDRRDPDGDSDGCVLPGAMQRMVNRLALSVPAQQEEDPPDEAEEKPAERKPKPAKKERPRQRDENTGAPQTTADDMIQRTVESHFSGSGGGSAEAQRERSDDDERKGVRLPPEEQKLQIQYDKNQGVFVVKGPKLLVDDVKDWLDDLDEEIEKFPVKPDIRIYRVRYIDVHTAQDIVEEMFNATKQQRKLVQQQQQMMRAQQVRAQQLARQRQAQQAQQPQQGGRGQPQPGQQQGRPGQQQQQQQQKLEMPQLPPTAVRVYPNPRDRTLILRADSSQYPAILELLAKIDQPKPFDSELRIFPLQKLNAADVEEMLKTMLGLDAPSARRSSRSAAATRGRRGARAPAPTTTGPGATLPRTILEEVSTGTGVLGVDPEDIMLSSSEESNSIIVMAPPAALEFVGELIEKLESEDVPTRETRYFELEHAPVDEVVEYLTDHYTDAGRSTRSRSGGRRSAKGGDRGAVSTGGDLRSPTFIAYPRLNMLTVQAPIDVLTEVGDLIARLDTDSAQEQWEDIILDHADAGQVADTLTQMFAGAGSAPSRGRRGAAAPSGSTAGPLDARFIGEEGGRIVLYRAPATLRKQILDAVAKLEETAKQTSSIHVMRLEHATASRVAEAIESAYGGSRGGGARRGQTSAAQFTVTAHDPSRQLFVRADDARFAEVESLVKTLDVPGGLGFDFRIYPLQYADARQVHTTMTQLLKSYMQQLGPASKDMTPFSVEVNDAANALVVLGGPQVFGFLEENLAKIDTPAAAQQREVHVVTLTTADAASVAKTLTDIFITGAGKPPPGAAPPVSISAIQGSPTLLIKCGRNTFAEIEPIIQQLDSDEAAAGEVRVVTLLYSDASEMHKALQETLKKQGGGPRGGGQELIGGVRVSALAQGNALVISGNLEQVDNLEATIKQLDAAGEKGSVPQIIVLEHARVSHVLPTLQEMIGEKRGGRNQPAPIIASNEPLNALVVRAGQTDMAWIEGMIAKMDTPDFPAQPGIRVVQLAQGINISDLAEKVETSVNKGSEVRAARGGGKSKAGSITVTPDTRTNSLIIAGDSSLFGEAEDLARTMEEMGPSGGRETRIITVKNVEINEIERLIQQLTGQDTASGSSSRRSSGSSSARRPSRGSSTRRPRR